MEIHYGCAYDFYTLGKFNAGRATVRATFHTKGNDIAGELRFTIEWRPTLKRAPHPNDWVSRTVTIPLWFDRCSSCVLADEDAIKWDRPAPQMFANRDSPRHESSLQMSSDLRRIDSLSSQQRESEAIHVSQGLNSHAEESSCTPQVLQPGSRYGVAPIANMSPNPTSPDHRGMRVSGQNQPPAQQPALVGQWQLNH